MLLHRGRLSLAHLVRFTGLRPRTVRACILVLVQQNVLWHASEEDVEVFEVNTDECLARCRFGTYVCLMEELYGQEVGVAVVKAKGKALEELQLKTWVGERVAKFKVPKRIWFTDVMPKTATGKIQRRIVAETMMKMDGKAKL